jgi:hypothetical protein
MRTKIYILLLLICPFGCSTPKISDNQKYLIIEMAVDSALSKDIVLNTNDYWIDFSNVTYFDKSVTKEFLMKNVNFHEINADSLLKSDSTWIQYGFLDQMLIKFKNIEINNDSIIINLDKIKATDGSNGIEIIFKNIGGKIKVVSTEITWIS